MSRDQKPGRSDTVVIAPAQPAKTGESAATDAPAAPPAAARAPVALLAGLFVVASTVGGVGVALAERYLR